MKLRTWLYPAALLCLLSTAACGEADQEAPAIVETAGEDALVDPTAKTDAVVSGKPTRHPIVLVHGFAGSPTRNSFHADIVKALCRDGHAVYVAAQPPFQGVPDRARTLARLVDSVLAGTATSACGRPGAKAAKVNLIAHSMGGLDCRYLVAGLGYGDRVASVLTVSTPHRGSGIADMALGLFAGIDDAALNALGEFAGRVVSSAELAKDAQLRAAFESLSEARAGSFNAAVTNDKRVAYQSWAGLSNVAGIPNPLDSGACEGKMLGFRGGFLRHIMHLSLKPIAAVVAHGVQLIPNDALVTVASAKWGTFRGCIPADHADEVGAFGLTWSEFKYVDFYRVRAFELSASGL